MIATEKGERPVEALMVGDRVWTRRGLRRVEAVGNREEWTLHLSVAGREPLLLTPNHPVWVEGQGFLRADAVRYGDTLRVWDGMTFETSTGSDSVATQTHPIGRIASILFLASRIVSAAWRVFTGKSGRQRTGLFPWGVTSITQTAIPSTTSWATSSVLHRGSTYASIGVPSERKDNVNVWRRFVHWLPFGTVPKRDGPGTANMSRIPFTTTTANAGVKAAAIYTTLSLLNPDFARTPASRHGGGSRVWMTLSSLARSVARRLGATDTRRPKLARASAHGSCGDNDARRRVFNIQVEDAHEFFANGVLVHNCDALRYVAMSRPYLPILRETASETELQEAVRISQERGNRRGHLARVGSSV